MTEKKNGKISNEIKENAINISQYCFCGKK